MHPVASFSPSDFVDMLYSLEVPGYTGYPGGVVSISRYLCANASFGGNNKASVLSANLHRIAREHNETEVTSRPGFARLFTGQGSRENFIAAMSLIVRYQADFQRVHALQAYFTHTDFLQAMVDDGCFGLDCVGFVGNYLVDSGLENSYPSRRPLDYCSVFHPVRSLAEVTDTSVVMLTNGQHIQMIDEVTDRNPGSITVDLCQSSSGGPQCNIGVTIRAGGGDYLPVEEFRHALSTNQYEAEWNADNESRRQNGLNPRNYESYLRARMTQSNTMFGYSNGAIFTITGGGNPANPVHGSVYIGTAPISVANA